MHKRLKLIIKNTNEIFNRNYLETVAENTGFRKRKSGKLDPVSFLAFQLFEGEDLCELSLSRLCSRLSSKFNINISPEALNKKYNSNATDFLKTVYRNLLIKQNNILERNINNTKFNRILLTDSTGFLLFFRKLYFGQVVDK